MTRLGNLPLQESPGGYTLMVWTDPTGPSNYAVFAVKAQFWQRRNTKSEIGNMVVSDLLPPFL